MDGMVTRKLFGRRLHVRAMVRDGKAAFIGSQSLRRLELDVRREVGVVIHDARLARRIQEVFAEDWKAAKKAATSAA